MVPGLVAVQDDGQEQDRDKRDGAENTGQAEVQRIFPPEKPAHSHEQGSQGGGVELPEPGLGMLPGPQAKETYQAHQVEEETQETAPDVSTDQMDDGQNEKPETGPQKAADPADFRPGVATGRWHDGAFLQGDLVFFLSCYPGRRQIPQGKGALGTTEDSHQV